MLRLRPPKLGDQGDQVDASEIQIVRSGRDLDQEEMARQSPKQKILHLCNLQYWQLSSTSSSCLHFPLHRWQLSSVLPAFFSFFFLFFFIKSNFALSLAWPFNKFRQALHFQQFFVGKTFLQPRLAAVSFFFIHFWPAGRAGWFGCSLC